ncbi:carbohydrate sulfotransferase 12-like [Dunckerocampus dactyliophorus]|uniref:carbohydrate sulfotransferase 12-like n=1 Tax=Dunckerocampus dactyliophorus TaxID=161453 RepID=UPI002405048E|nr:carbohydrate sulfotransferase 12-like [Dunckerocampus dactyliophorus]
MVQEQDLRKTILRDMCKEEKEAFSKEKDKRINEVLYNLLVDDEHGIIYCFIPKVACGNWKRFMQVLKHGEPYPDPQGIPPEVAHNPKGLTSLASFPKVEREAKLKHYTKFMFVREPFVRLISAFREKFLKINQYYYEVYGRVFLRRYGNQPDPPLKVTEAFALGIRPSFYSFVQYLLDPMTNTHPFEPHWKQFHHQCQPCFIEYDFIGHQETLAEDALQLLTALNLEERIKFPPAYQNMTNPSSVSDWFKAVPLEDRRRLYKLYERDYKLFGYETPHTLLNDTL